jgi:hypothetical protein
MLARRVRGNGPSDAGVYVHDVVQLAAQADQPGERLSDLLTRCARSSASERVALGAIVALLGDRSIEALLLVLALPMALPIPAPGLSATFGVPLTIVAAQLALGRRRAWMPEVLARRSLTQAAFVKMIGYVLPTLRQLERTVQPRAEWLAAGWMKVPVGLVCLVLAALITLPIPFGNAVPGIAVSVLALGMLERDGVIVALGLAIAVLGLVLATVASAGALDVLSHWWQG